MVVMWTRGLWLKLKGGDDTYLADDLKAAASQYRGGTSAAADAR